MVAWLIHHIAVSFTGPPHLQLLATCSVQNHTILNWLREGFETRQPQSTFGELTEVDISN